MATTIYALCEPDLQVPVIRYIGKTVGPPQTRLSQHSAPNSAKNKTHLGYWLRSLRTRGERPVLMTLTEVPDEIGSAAEMLYIRLARDGGMDLVNATDGGEGAPGHIHTPEHRAATSAALKGRMRSPEWCAAISAGKKGVQIGPHSPEARTAQSKSQRGRKNLTASSVFSGVCWDASRKKWSARIKPDGKQIFLGRFKNEADAARAYDSAAVKFYGPTAKLNFPISSCGSFL